MSSNIKLHTGCGGPSYSLGAVLAIVLSWVTYHSIWYAILHGFCSWFYVLYYIVYNVLMKH